VAADVVELGPIPGLAAPDFLCAKLVYKLVGYHRESRETRAAGRTGGRADRRSGGQKRQQR
jgi:hypothetical protein